MKHFLLLFLAAFFFTGCTASFGKQTFPDLGTSLPCKKNDWSCTDKGNSAEVRFDDKPGYVVIEKIEGSTSLETVYEEKKRDVYRYPGNEFISEGEIQNGKYFVNKNTFSHNMLLRSIIERKKTLFLCSGFVAEKDFANAEELFKEVCSLLR